MSEVERPAPTAGGDACIVETIKADQVLDNSSQSPTAIELEPTNVPGNAAAPIEQVVMPIPNAQIKTDFSVEVDKANVLVDEVANPPTSTAETSNTTAEIADTIAKDSKKDTCMIQTDTQKNLCPVVVPTATSQSVNENKADKLKQNDTQAKDNAASIISKLEAEVRIRTKERDSYQQKLESTEKKLTTLQAAYDAITSQSGDGNILQQSVEQLRGQLAQTALMYEERNRVVASQENQINALNNQVTSLKEVVSITRDLLQIRNMEVKQLQTEVDNMEKKITEERERHNTMINKMDAAMQLNADLKKEYETQLSLFQSLREKYGEKINLLSEEKRALEAAAGSTPK